MNEEDATDSDPSDTSDGADQPIDSESNGADGSEAAEATESEPDSGGSDEGPDSDTVAWVAETDPADVAAELDDLQDEVETLTAERDRLADEVESLEERVQRVQADFQNYKKRTERRREEEQARATQDVVERLLPVRDNLARALDQDEDSGIREGVEATLDAFDDVLQAEGVEVIEPSPGDTVDPTRHEVVHREDEDADAIASVYRRGYEMDDRVLRAAQVTVGSGAEPDTDEPGSEQEAER